jgi:hypothetical protein
MILSVSATAAAKSDICLEMYALVRESQNLCDTESC